ncbi:MAG: transglutaminase domain-containing protein [Promethearchaeota archaeon]
MKGQESEEKIVLVCPLCGKRTKTFKCTSCGASLPKSFPLQCPKCNILVEYWKCLHCKHQWRIPSKPITIATLQPFDVKLDLPSVVLVHVDELRRYHAHPDTALSTYVKAVLHDCNLLRWPGPCNAVIESWGRDCAATARKAIDVIVNQVERRFDSGLPQVIALYELVRDYVNYQSETGQVLRFPIETLTLGKGDCEDQAMALAALYKAAGYDTAIVRLWDSERSFHHICCAIRADEWINHGLWTLGGDRDEDYIWKVLDPAFIHPFNELPSWIQDYKDQKGKPWVPPEVGSALYVSWDALSDKMRKDVIKIG